jgi:hypothetical protein
MRDQESKPHSDRLSTRRHRFVSCVIAATLLAQVAIPAYASPARAETDSTLPSASTGEPPVSPAPENGGDTMYLRDGKALSGQIIQIQDGERATIRLPSGQDVVIPWDSIDRIDRRVVIPGASPQANESLSRPQGAVDDHPLGRPGAPEAAYVHVEAGPGAQLFSVGADSKRRETKLCSAPCDVELPLGNTYSLHVPGGHSTLRSPPFHLNAHPGQYVIISASIQRAGAGDLAFLLTWFGLGAVSACVPWSLVAPRGPGPQQSAIIVTLALAALMLPISAILLTLPRVRTKQTVIVMRETAPPAPVSMPTS